jgi:hypothetical protein
MNAKCQRSLITVLAAAAAVSVATIAHGGSVLILGGSTTPDADETAVQTLLDDNGQTASVGPSISTFTGTDFSDISSVILLDGDGSTTGFQMPTAGQTALLNFIQAGGGLVTGEWSVWTNDDEGNLTTLAPAFPVVPTTVFDYSSPLT